MAYRALLPGIILNCRDPMIFSHKAFCAALLALLLPCLSLAAQVPGDGYAGTASCGGCHAKEMEAWQGSHHDMAMRHASPETVVGDFDNATVTVHGVTSRFFTRDGKYFVHTDGPDGTMQDFEIAYTFGIEPLQQYLVAFPDGRIQALGLAWDDRPGAEGGQRWYHLFPEEPLAAGDDFHWTGAQQNWNYMCADCHSTNLRKKLRRGAGPVRHDLGGDQRGLRSLPRTGRKTCRVGHPGTGSTRPGRNHGTRDPV